MRIGPAKNDELVALYRRLGFNRWADELSVLESPVAAKAAPTKEAALAATGDEASTIGSVAPT